MPCCLATLQFRQCRHSMLLKLGCTKPDCTAMCPSKRRQFLFRARYMWRCEDCVDHDYSQDSESRADEWDAYYAKLDADSSIAKESRRSITMTQRQKEFDEDAIKEHRRLGCVMEIQTMIDWVEEYSKLLWTLAYNKDADFEKSLARLEYLRHVKPWELIIIFDFLRESNHPWDKESLPACIEQLVLAPSTSLDKQTTSPGQLGRAGNAQRPHAPLFYQSSGDDENHEASASSGSDPEKLAFPLLFSEDSAKETEDTERFSDNDCVGEKMDVDVQDADSPDIPVNPQQTYGLSYAAAPSECSSDYSTAQADDEDADDEKEPNYIF